MKYYVDLGSTFEDCIRKLEGGIAGGAIVADNIMMQSLVLIAYYQCPRSTSLTQ